MMFVRGCPECEKCMTLLGVALNTILPPTGHHMALNVKRRHWRHGVNEHDWSADILRGMEALA